MKKVAVVLSGCGVFDGAEIHESVLLLLALNQRGYLVTCFAPDKDQHHVINHLTGEEMPEKRNIRVEAARIARGQVESLSSLHAKDYDALCFPGGFGAAKNLSTWAFDGPSAKVDPEVQRVVLEFVDAKKPILATCIAPATLAKALEKSGRHVRLTVGNTAKPSSNGVAAVSAGMKQVGAIPVECEVDKVVVDEAHKIITTPCYMMDVGIASIHHGIQQAVEALNRLL